MKEIKKTAENLYIPIGTRKLLLFSPEELQKLFLIQSIKGKNKQIKHHWFLGLFLKLTCFWLVHPGSTFVPPMQQTGPPNIQILAHLPRSQLSLGHRSQNNSGYLEEFSLEYQKSHRGLYPISKNECWKASSCLHL